MTLPWAFVIGKTVDKVAMSASVSIAEKPNVSCQHASVRDARGAS